jgi:hypothetical protein
LSAIEVFRALVLEKNIQPEGWRSPDPNSETGDPPGPPVRLDQRAGRRRRKAIRRPELDRSGLFVSVYNHPLCVLDPDLQRFARASISDWKNAYLAECERCALRHECGGLFASSQLRRSRGIAAVAADRPGG